MSVESNSADWVRAIQQICKPGRVALGDARTGYVVLEDSIHIRTTSLFGGKLKLTVTRPQCGEIVNWCEQHLGNIQSNGQGVVTSPKRQRPTDLAHEPENKERTLGETATATLSGNSVQTVHDLFRYGCLVC